MSKIVKTVIVVAIAVAVVVFAPQIAAVLASVAGSLGVTVAATAISSALIGMGISMALTAAATLFRKAPSMSQSMVDRLNTSVVPTASRKIIFGTTAGGADVRFFEGDLDLPSTKKDGYVQVIALASHRINSLKQFYVENDLVWQNGAFVSKRNGFAPNNPFRVVTEGKPGNGFAVGSGRYWNSSSTFTGCAYYVPFWKLDTDVWESGIPQRLTAIVEGCPLYDPRRDSTRGGSGTHRVNDQTTYAFRDGATEIGRNPALALLTYLLGWRINGKVVWGMGIPANRIDFDNFRTYANLCEEGVAAQGGGTVQRYTVDGIFSTTDSHETVINGVTATMGSCKLTDRGGTYCIVGGYDDTAGPKVAFDADDLIAPANGSSPYIWNPAPASRERFNIVRGRFANPEELYQLTDWGDPIEREPLADGIPRTMSVDLGAVSRAETCQRIAKQMLLREYLCPGTFAATFGPKAFAVEIGSVITLSLPAEGWNNKLFRVMEQAESHDLFFQMTLREEDPAIYAWDREEKPLPAMIRPQGYDASTTIAPSNLALTSASYSGANGVNVSEVHVTWTPELSGRVNGIQIQSRPAGTDAWSEQAALFDPKIGMFTFTSNAPGITVEVQARFRMMSAVYSPWVSASVATAEVITVTDWENVTNTSGTRPADNATVGAPVGTNVGSVEAGTLVNTANTANTNASTALNAVKDKNGVVRGIQTVIDSVTAEVTRAKQEVAATRSSLNVDIAAAKQEGSTARSDLAGYKTQANSDIAAAKQEGTTARTDLATEVSRAKGAEGAISTSVTNLKTTVDGHTTTISDNYTTLTNATTALAIRSATLESKAGSNGAINVNPTFTQYTNTTNTPDGWTYDNQTNGGATRVAGETNGYAVQLASSANTSAYAGQSLPAVSANSNWVIEADVKLNSGTLNGAGVLFRAGPDYRIVFASDKDSTDTVVGAGTVGQTYRFRKLVQMSVAATGSALWYMSHWSALGDVSTANSLTWYRCAIRPATDAEIKANKADIALNTPSTGVIARLGTEETTRANADSAIATRTTNLETTVNNGTTGNAALFTKIGTEETARSNGVSALATRATVLESAARPSGNLLPTSTFDDPTATPGWYYEPAQFAAVTTYGRNLVEGYYPVLENALNVSQSNADTAFDGWWQSDVFAIVGGQRYQVSARLQGRRCLMRLHVTFFDSTGAAITTNAIADHRDDGAGLTTLATWPVKGGFVTAPANAARAYFRVDKEPTASGQTNSFGGFTQPMFCEAGALQTELTPYTPSANRSAQSATLARLKTEETTRSGADSALATRASNLESTVNSGTDGNAALKSRIGTEETTRANAVSALATRTTVMESAGSGTGSLNANSNYALWPDGAPLPTKWTYWESPSGWALNRVPSGRPTSPYAVRIAAPANAECGIGQWYNDSSTNVPMTPGWYVAECDVTLEGGTWNGSGMTIQGVYNYNFATQPDINGVTSATQTGNRRFSWLAQNTGSYTNWHPMTNWAGFGTLRDAKTLIWYRAAIRPATDAEILAKKADTALNTPGTGVVARITAEETTRAGADSALVSKTDTMITEYRGNNTNLNTRIFNEETARSNGDSALATRSTALEARTIGGGNLITNTDFLSSTSGVVADGWNAFSVTNPAPVFAINVAGDPWHLPSENALSIFQSGQAGASGYTGYTSNRFAVTPGGYLQAYCFMATHRCQSELIIYWFDGAGNTLTASTSGAAGGTGAEQNGGQNINAWRQSGFPAVAVPSGAVQASLELRKYNTNPGQSDSYTWFTRPYAGAARTNTTEFTPFSPGSAKAGITATTARIGAEETTRANADSALSTRTQNLESSVNSGGNNLGALRASINDEATTRANADSAVASRTSFLETTATATAGTNIVSNDKFAIWRDGQPNPDRWVTWAGEGNYRTERSAGIKGSPYCFRTLNDNTDVNSGFVQTIRITPGKWVMEVTAESDGSGFRGAGITLSGIYNLDFCAVPDINGTAGDTVNSIRSYAMVFDVSHNQDLSFHCMHGWSGFGRGMAAKYMKWHAVSLRPAGPGDSMGVANTAAIATANVRIGNEETARSNADSALGTRTNTLESNYSTVRNNLDTWNNDRYQDYLRVNSRVAAEETTRANADSAIANRTSVVEAQVSTDINNLLRNGIFNAPNWVGRGGAGVPPSWALWSQDGAAFIGASPRDSRYGAPAPLQIDRNGINNGIYQGLPPLPKGWYVFEVDITGEDGNWSGSGLHCNFSNGSAFNFGFGTNADYGGRTGDIGTANRQFSWMFYNASDSNGPNLYLMAGWSGFQGSTNYGFLRTIWHRVVMRPATEGEINARKVADSNLIARVSTTESAVSSLNGRTSAYWQVQAVAGNNRAQMTVRADANGGAGVDIVGDVNFSGNLNVGPDSGGNRMKLTNSGLWLYDANGTLRAQLSL